MRYHEVNIVVICRQKDSDTIISQDSNLHMLKSYVKRNNISEYAAEN